MKIPLTDLKWYAAYHDESYHPHVHMVVYSTGKEPYLTKQGIRNLKAAFAKQIFRHDLLQVYVEQTNQRNELTGGAATFSRTSLPASTPAAMTIRWSRSCF